jgi:hypothetical protein
LVTCVARYLANRIAGRLEHVPAFLDAQRLHKIDGFSEWRDYLAAYQLARELVGGIVCIGSLTPRRLDQGSARCAQASGETAYRESTGTHTFSFLCPIYAHFTLNLMEELY